MSIAAVIVAAGSGSRAGDGGPKQYRALAGRPLLSWTIDSLAAHAEVSRIVVAIDPAAVEAYRSAAEHSAPASITRLAPPAAGGDSRQASVRAGLEALSAAPPDFVLIHDAARPFLPGAVIDRALRTLREDGVPGACAALPVADTLRREENGLCGALVARDGLWRAQTPQCFAYASILDAHRRLEGRGFTDDAELARAAGLDVALIEGAESAAKITLAEDFAWAERIAERWGGGAPAAPDIRIGQGFDAHRFGVNADGSSDHVMLCGLRIAHDAGLSGHSDADVGLHALTDAVLGAAALGDIGTHFPPSEEKWRGAESAAFLAGAAAMARGRGARIGHLDVTLICERPKIGPHVAAMRARIAAIAEIGVERVSVKATTTEGLGFAGRGEGIAAMASATLVFG